jgi:hypothetical protein
MIAETANLDLAGPAIRTERFRPREAAHGGDALIRRQLLFWDLATTTAKTVEIARPFLRAAAFYAASQVEVSVSSAGGRVGVRIGADHGIVGHAGQTLHDFAGPGAAVLARAADWDAAFDAEGLSLWFEVAVDNWLHPVPPSR